MKITVLFSLAVLGATSVMAVGNADQVCSQLCCKKVTTTKAGLIGRQCKSFTPGSGAPSFVPDPSCPDQPLCCKTVLPGNSTGFRCSRIYF
ncbi:hypothetical protein OC846_002016 [Tilletia horrida]|uniref:Hydrophobin n=1 Tax=Tilletia horrida TaxID=155126 RepID=A0AAN6GUE5_9BASI|nr:hypothetical protein OC845_002167 [Tilletia horrida]KAK0554682.1 hypothetical protein OC846_002016 [Tilletia horrida]KAK0569814.1 hypothetical protein OC861_000525 [Tilletia horrida]